MDELVRHLNNSRRVLLASHANPDGDAIGSLIAMGLALQAMGKETVLFNESQIPAVYRFLPLVDRVVRSIGDVSRFDTAVILDCGNLDRIGGAAEAVARIPVIINIDHHITNSGFGDVRLVDPSACATAEILWRIVGRLGVELNESIAAAIKSSGVEEKVNHKSVMLPGGVAVLSGKLEEESGWSVQVGPRESSGLPTVLRAWSPN